MQVELVMNDFPPELIDDIIGHISPDDLQSFRNCSLVARSWVHSSRSSLFKSVDLRREAHLRSWLNNISSKNLGVLEYVRALAVNAGITSDEHSEVLASSLPLFPKLKRLVLFRARMSSIAQLGMSLAPQQSLECLSLDGCYLTINALTKLINHFPNLVQLELRDILPANDGEPIPSTLLRPLRKLITNEPDTGEALGILDQFLGLRPRCEEVIIDVYACAARSLPQRIIDGVGATVKCLNVRGNMNCVENPLRLENCRELRELEVHSLGLMEPYLITTITSTRVQKIIFVQSSPFLEYVSALPNCNYWSGLDDALCELVDRLEYGRLLEVEYRFPSDFGWTKRQFSECLPGLHEKDRAKVVGVQGSAADFYFGVDYFSEGDEDD